MAVSLTSDPLTVFIDGEDVHIYDFRETDHEVVALVREAEDPELAIHHCLTVGARALRAAGVSVDATIVEHEFARLQVAFDGKLSEMLTQLGEVAEGLLEEEDGELSRVLRAHKTELATLLGDTFDPDSKRSVIAKFEETFSELGAAQLKALRQAVDPDDEHSSLGRLRRDLLGAFKEQSEANSKAVGALAEKIAGGRAAAEVLELTAVKGRRFEEAIFDLTTSYVSPLGDLAEHVGDAAGTRGGKTGDVLVTINRDDVRGAAASYVIEAKDERRTLKAALDELDKAMANREAGAGIIVFPRDDKAPIGTPFRYFDNKAIVICDKQGDDSQALRLALMWARWVVQRQLSNSTDEFDTSEAAALIDQGMRALSRMTPIKRALSCAGKEIGNAEKQIVALGDEVEQSLTRLRDML